MVRKMSTEGPLGCRSTSPPAACCSAMQDAVRCAELCWPLGPVRTPRVMCAFHQQAMGHVWYCLQPPSVGSGPLQTQHSRAGKPMSHEWTKQNDLRLLQPSWHQTIVIEVPNSRAFQCTSCCIHKGCTALLRASITWKPDRSMHDLAFVKVWVFKVFCNAYLML